MMDGFFTITMEALPLELPSQLATTQGVFTEEETLAQCIHKKQEKSDRFRIGIQLSYPHRGWLCIYINVYRVQFCSLSWNWLHASLFILMGFSFLSYANKSSLIDFMSISYLVRFKISCLDVENFIGSLHSKKVGIVGLLGWLTMVRPNGSDIFELTHYRLGLADSRSILVSPFF